MSGWRICGFSHSDGMMLYLQAMIPAETAGVSIFVSIETYECL